MKILTIIPAYNEAQNISQVIEELSRDFPETDILVVNDCSSDDTEGIVRSTGVCCVSQPFNMGYAAALQTGFKYAVHHNYDYIIQFDGDGQHIADEARKLYQHATTHNFDVVIGSRYIGQTGYKNSFFRNLGTNFFRWLISVFCAKTIYDPTSGLQVLSRKYYTIFSSMNGYAEYPDANLLIELLKSGAIVDEVPVKMRNRIAGESMHGGIVKPIKYMILMTYSIFIVLLRKRNRFSR